MNNIKTRFSSVKTSISQTESEFNLPLGSVQLLAVSKTWPASHLRELAALGQQDFGENYLQEALEKIDALRDLQLCWHFIGPIQSNKTRPIAEQFEWVHSVDRLKIAQRLSAQRPENLPDLNICIQINIDQETSKSGINASELMVLAEHISTLPKLALRGLMIIPAKVSSLAQHHDTFIRAKQLFDQLSAAFPQVDTLSMGMSADMAIAIQHGSNMVRIGSALFGQRSTPKEQAKVH